MIADIFFHQLLNFSIYSCLGMPGVSGPPGPPGAPALAENYDVSVFSSYVYLSFATKLII